MPALPVIRKLDHIPAALYRPFDPLPESRKGIPEAIEIGGIDRPVRYVPEGQGHKIDPFPFAYIFFDGIEMIAVKFLPAFRASPIPAGYLDS